MRMPVVKRAVPLLLLGLVMLTVAGCFGGNRNFVSGEVASAQAAPGNQGSPSGQTTVGVNLGNLAPDFSLKALDGSTVRLSDLRGKPVMVNFWASWCPPCKEEMPVFEKTYQTYKKDVVFLGLDFREDPGTVQKFVKDNGYSWTFLLDSDGQAAKSYLVTGVPESYFIDRNGIIRDKQIGPLTESLLQAKLDKIR